MNRLLPPEHWATEAEARAALSSAFWELEQALRLLHKGHFSEAGTRLQQADELFDDALGLITWALAKLEGRAAMAEARGAAQEGSGVTEPTFSLNDVVQILRNMGHDVDCGACMSVAFTGVTAGSHTCESSMMKPRPGSGDAAVGNEAAAAPSGSALKYSPQPAPGPSAAGGLVWRCGACGNVEPVETEGYDVGDNEPCVHCDGGVAVVLSSAVKEARRGECVECIRKDQLIVLAAQVIHAAREMIPPGANRFWDALYAYDCFGSVCHGTGSALEPTAASEGRCAECGGSGVSDRVGRAGYLCPACHGTGVAQAEIQRHCSELYELRDEMLRAAHGQIDSGDMRPPVAYWARRLGEIIGTGAAAEPSFRAAVAAVADALPVEPDPARVDYGEVKPMGHGIEQLATKCNRCSGTGACFLCDGTGRFPPYTAAGDLMPIAEPQPTAEGGDSFENPDVYDRMEIGQLRRTCRQLRQDLARVEKKAFEGWAHAGKVQEERDAARAELAEEKRKRSETGDA